MLICFDIASHGPATARGKKKLTSQTGSLRLIPCRVVVTNVCGGWCGEVENWAAGEPNPSYRCGKVCWKRRRGTSFSSDRSLQSFRFGEVEIPSEVVAPTDEG